jgi:formamidopyrimidine-DNA glycosylase
MPELPEVEREARRLREALVGRRGLVVDVRDARVCGGADGARAVEERCAGRQVQGVDREGKHLVLALGGGVALALHLRMTGRIELTDAAAPPPRHARLGLRAEDRVAWLVDVRRFATARAGTLAEVGRAAGLDALGPDALALGRDAPALGRALAGCRAPLHAALLDQRRVAGLGNIHATEALFRARLHPARPAGSLSAAEVQRLARGLRAALAFGLREALRDDFAYLADGGENRFLVYGRAGARCPRCRRAGRPTALTAARLGGRTVVHCPVCQAGERAPGGMAEGADAAPARRDAPRAARQRRRRPA